MPTLLSNATATGNAVVWSGGRGTFAVEATFSGATIKLQAKGPNGTWIDVGSDVSFTANGMGNFELPSGTEIRAFISGSPTGAYATATHFRA